MSAPNGDEIQAEIKKLEELKPKVRRYTMFGDDNHAAIDIQIRVLKGEVDQDELDEMQSMSDISDHEYDNGTEALNWLEGESEYDKLSDGWAELVQ